MAEVDDLKHWVDKYVNELKEPFPAFELAGIPEERKIDMIKKALGKKQPIEIEYKDDILY